MRSTMFVTEGDSLLQGFPPAGPSGVRKLGGAAIASTDRRLRAAENQLLFRAVNERIKELGEKVLDAVSEIDFTCECHNMDCHNPITITIEEFEAIDRADNRFIVCRGHEDLDVEDVVAEHDGYLIVARRGAAAEVVKEGS
jgi:hypothetical protein